jgi:hypothetical protein
MADEKVVIGVDTKYPLNGILTIPNETNGLFPAVILVHGSGPSNMDEKSGNNYPFKRFTYRFKQNICCRS